MSEVRREKGEKGVRNRFPLFGKRFLTPFSLTLIAAAAVGVGVWWWSRMPPPEPPEPDLAEVDPEVVEAIAAARQAVRRRPNDGGVWGRLGMVLLAHDFHPEAQRCFAEAERLDPTEVRWPYLRGLSLLLTEPDAGLRCLQRVAESSGKDPPPPRLRLAETLLTQGRLDDAEHHLEQTRKAEPDNPRLQLNLGRLALLRGQWQSALELLEPCTNDIHARRLAHTLRAEAWTHLHEPDKARAEQRQATEAPEDQLWPDPFVEDVVQLQCGLAVRLRQVGDLLAQRRYPQAVQLLDETVQRYPQSTTAWLHLGDTWRQLGRPDRAEPAFREAVRIDPDSPDAWFRLGYIQALDRPGEAADSFRRAIRLKPDHALAHFNLANLLKQLDDPAGAADEFRAALRCQPDYAPARDALRELENHK
ncbi:MAG TPA: tetratricopeptide repeat protein [Gemmataceae bacterium]|jgi:tetratricopeptide (TPR) repeat protein